jgi:hypothetical protein
VLCCDGSRFAIPCPDEFVDEGVIICFGYSLEEEVLGAEEIGLLSVVVVVDCCFFGYPLDDERLLICWGDGVATLSLLDEVSFLGKMSEEWKG